MRCQLELFGNRKNADVYLKIHNFCTIQIVQIVDSVRTWTKNSRDFSGCTLRHDIRDEKLIYDSKKGKSFENTYKHHENSLKKICLK